MFFLAGWPCLAPAADRAAPVHSVDGSFVREWLVLGPFPARDMEPDFLANVGGEANVRPKEGDTVTRSDGTPLTWTRLRSEFDLVNLEKVLGIQSWSVAYAYCELSSDRPMDTDFRPSLYTSLVWINGKKIEPNLVRPQEPNEILRALPIHLEAGPNPCLLKLNIGALGSQEWVFTLQPLPQERASAEFLVTDGEGRPVPDALIQLYDQGEPVWRLTTGASGQAEACLYPLAKAYDLRVTSGERGAWLYGVAFQAGERRTLKLVLNEAVSILGQVLALDRSPQNAIVVQALREPDGAGTRMEHVPAGNGRIQSLLPMPPFSETVLSGTNGNFQFVNLRPGFYRLRCHGPEGFISPTNNPGEMNPGPVLVAPGRTNEFVQFVFANAKKGVWQNYQITRGLTQLNPVSIHRTSDGLLWVGTSDGTVHSYDGVSFRMLQISGNFVNSIDHDPAGTVWIGTSGGISRTVNGQIQPLGLDDRLPRRNIQSVHADSDGTVWFATSSGVGKYQGGKFITQSVEEGLPMNSIESIAHTREGVVWAGTGIGLVKVEGGKFSVPLVASGPVPMDVRSIHQSKDGALWFGGNLDGREGLFRFDGKTLGYLGAAEGVLSNAVYAVAETSNGDVWIGTKNGLSRFNGTTIVNYTEQDGLSNDWVRDIYVDQDDVLWLANGWGVSRFDPNNFFGLSHQDGLHTGSRAPTGVFAIEPDQENGFLVGTQWGGIYRINRPGRQPVVTPGSLPYVYVRQIHRDNKGTLWFGTSNGIYKQVDGALTKVLERNWVIALTSDDQGHLWFGNGWNGGGASRFEPSTGVEAVFTKKNGLPDDAVWALERSPGRGVWIGTETGLVHADGETIEDASGRLGLPKAPVYSLRRDAHGTLWISTGKGLYYWNGTNTVSITSTNGLPDEHVWCSAQTPDGTIWIGTGSNGLIGYDGKAMTVLDQRDGLLGNKVFTVAPDADRSLWVGFLDGGLSRYTRSKSRPSIRLLDVNMRGQTLTNMSGLPRTETGREVRIRYQEIDLKTHPEKRQFYYRLTSQSGGTVRAGVTKDRSFDWTPEKRGDYTFEVQAIDRDLNYSEPARVLLHAFVPWHANAWILTPAIAAFGGLLAWAFVARALYIRKSREAALLRERVRIARDLHDHLGAGLTHLAMVGDVVEQRAEQPGTVQMLARQLTESARQLTRTMGEVIWTTDPDSDTVGNFSEFLTSYAERFFGESNVRLRFEVPRQIPDLSLSAEYRSTLLTVAKEALNNAAKHAKASELRIKLEVNDHELRMSFEDNGRGFARSEVPAGHRGLGNMEQRLRDLGGQVEIESAPGRGTRVTVRVRLPRK
jgi:signal transduction histidine kinase/streptogramin lyase